MTGIRVVTKRHRQALCLAMAVVCAGCTREPDPIQRHVPAPDLARAAVEAVLRDWQAGKSLGTIDRLAVKVQVSDNQRRPGQKLEEFEILGEVPSATPRCFAVRLRFSRPEAEEKVRYVVVGIDPLWVFRQEDIEMLGHWDHPMPDETTEGAGSENEDRERLSEAVEHGQPGADRKSVERDPPPKNAPTEPAADDPRPLDESGPPHEQ